MENVYTLSLLLCGIYGFNIDTDQVIQFKGQRGSYFGYSAVMLRNNDGPWAVVGSVKANFSDDAAVKTPGNVYKCRMDLMAEQQQQCEPLNPRRSVATDRWKFPSTPGFEEDNELLGASMAVIDDKIVTCAPLWKNMIPVKYNSTAEPIGKCFNLDRSLDMTKMTTFGFRPSIFNASIKGGEAEFKYQFAQIGFAISDKKYSESPLDVLLGAPGFIENKGGFLQYSATILDTSTSDDFYDFFTSQSFDSDDQKKAIDQCSQMGFSITTGRSSATCRDVVALGTPHFSSVSGIVGAVLVVCAAGAGTDIRTLSMKKQFYGEKSGSAFGYSVVFADINNDGLDDLLVGAPLFFDKTLDGGAVYIYYGDSASNVLLRVSGQKLQGKEEFGRFGTAIQTIGDVNKDGYNDVAVGAPFERDLRGAVYIYHGGPTELTFTQRIQSQDIDLGLRSFGWYIGTANDIDNNDYSDFLVGSYMSDHVAVLRTRPIINLRCRVSDSPSLIPLNSSGLDCQDPTFRPCVTIRLCFDYTGNNVPDKLRVTFNISSDTMRTKEGKSSRVRLSSDTQAFNSPDIRRVTKEIYKGPETCNSYYAVVEDVNREFFMSLSEKLEIEASYELSPDPVPGQVSPVLNNVPSVIYSSANFSTGCEGECRPDLVLTSSLNHDVIKLGEMNEILLRAKVINTGDLSHRSQISIKPSSNTKYIGFFQPLNEPTEPVFCEEKIDQFNSSTVVCSLRNTLFQQQQAVFTARFAVSRDLLLGEDSDEGSFIQQIKFTTSAEATSPDQNPADNTQVQIATVKLQSLVQLVGISAPDQLTVSEKADKILNFVHTYDIRNRGPSPLFNSTIHICIPVINEDGKAMLSKDAIMVVENSPRLRWRLIRFPGDASMQYETDETGKTTTRRTTQQITSTLPPREDSPINRKRRETEKLTDNTPGNKIKEISCNTVDRAKQAVIEVTVNKLEKDEEDSFKVNVNISENSLSFVKVSKIIYKSIGTVISKNDNRFIIIPMNTTTEVSSDIFPKEPPVETQQVNIWIIVGGCIGGLLLLIAMGVALWKCGFFKRKKKDDLKKWKRQSGYYAKRQSMRAGSTKSSNYKQVDEWNS